MVCDGGLGRGFESLHRAPKVLKLGSEFAEVWAGISEGDVVARARAFRAALLLPFALTPFRVADEGCASKVGVPMGFEATLGDIVTWSWSLPC
jgi:hypothetical protein